MEGGDSEALEEEIDLAKKRFGLSRDTEVVSCYEAGRDGFWIHRFLESIGVMNHVLDASSIEVKRRGKKRKTDRLDLQGLLRVLMRYCGESGGCAAWCECRARRRKTHGTFIGS